MTLGRFFLLCSCLSNGSMPFLSLVLRGRKRKRVRLSHTCIHAMLAGMSVCVYALCTRYVDLASSREMKREMNGKCICSLYALELRVYGKDVGEHMARYGTCDS